MNDISALETDTLLGVVGGMRASAPQVAAAVAPGRYWLALLGETIVDKLPAAPNRTDPGGAIGRFVSSVFAAGRLALREERSPLVAATVAGVTAVISTKICFEVRKRIGEVTHIPDAIVALGEDALVMSILVRLRGARGDVFGR